MQFFIDSASIKEIREAGELGLLDGVTTNPSLISKVGRPFNEIANEICQYVKGPVNLEVLSLDSEGMVNEGRRLRQYGENVVVKIPLTVEGLKAVKKLNAERIPTNVTLCFHPTQALLAAKAGATYISPFIGRLDDISQDGMNVVQDILTIFQNYHFETKVLVASIRHPMHVLSAAKMGAHVATLPIKVIHQLAKHPLTDLGLKTFLDDWKKTLE